MDYDAELRLHNDVLRGALEIRATDHALDIGCGTGQTTRDAARVAVEGSVLGVDISEPAVARAREIARAEGLRNAAFEVGDAQIHPFKAATYDVALSRFGTMFFADPVAAFTNVARALRRGGRLVMMVWQRHHLNEWSASIERALSADTGSVRHPATLDPFSLADPTTVARTLDAAGFARPSFADVEVPVYYGPDVEPALEWVRRFASTQALLRRLEPGPVARALDRLRATLATHRSARGIWFGSRGWLVTAYRR